MPLFHRNEIVTGLSFVRSSFDAYFTPNDTCTGLNNAHPGFDGSHIYDGSGSLRRTLFLSQLDLRRLGPRLTSFPFDNGTGSGLVSESKKSFGAILARRVI